MAAKPFPWYRRLFGRELMSCRNFKNVHKDTEISSYCESVDSIFDRTNDGVECYVVGVYFTSFDVAVDEKTNQVLQLYHAVNNNCDAGSDNSNSPSEKRGNNRLFIIVLVGLGVSASRKGDKKMVEDVSCQKIQELPWYLAPPSEKKLVEQLTRKFEIKTLTPTLVLLDGTTGEVITKHGLDRLLSDPAGTDFPWRPLPLPRLLDNIQFLPGGQSVEKDRVPSCRLDGHIIGFYFSAHWCPPCRCFTPLLIETYARLKARNLSFEVVFVSFDRSIESYDAYLNTMPWIAVPYHMQDCRQELAALFGVQGIPSLILTDVDGTIITSDGRREVSEDPMALRYPWRMKQVNVLTERLAHRLQENAAMVLFIEGDKSEVEFAENLLNEAAVFLRETFTKDEKSLLFFVACDNETSDTLKDVIGADDTVPLLAIINLPEGEWFVLEDDNALNQESINKMISRYFNKELAFTSIGKR